MEISKRVGRFTSSQMYKIMKTGRGEFGFGAPALTYIEEKQIEKRMGSCLDVGGYSQAMAWGNFMEQIVLDHLGLKYDPVSDKSVLHPDPKLAPYWSGSCDLIVPDLKIGEIKCYQKKKFAQYTDCLLKKDVAYFKENFDEEYWQIVSNAILNDVDYGEAISFMPYMSELEPIRDMARAAENLIEPWKYRFIYEQSAAELPVLPDGGYYKNLNLWEFLIPIEDKELLTERVEYAIDLLNRDQSPKA